jgi:hypothetical protein
MGTSLSDMGNQTHEALAYIGREYKDAKGRVELQRHVVAQLPDRSRPNRGRGVSQRAIG